MTVNQFLVAPAIIRCSNMILTVSKRVAERFTLDSVKIFPLPLFTNPLRLKLIWHKRTDANPGTRWIRNKIVNIQQGLIEKYDLQAEQQRQIRDDESRSIEDRIKANEKLGEILDKQDKIKDYQLNLNEIKL